MTTRPNANHVRTRSLLLVLASACLVTSGATSTPASAAVRSAPAEPSLAMSAPRQAQAQAHRVVHHDARGDVLRFDVESEASRPAPRDRATDITRTVVDHQSERLAVRAHVRDLGRAGYHLMITEILTSEGRRYELDVDYSIQPIGPRVSLRRFASGTEITCPGAAWSLRRSTDRVAVSVPTSCLGDPGWIRAGVGLVAATRDLATSLADDSRTRGRVGNRHLELGPRQPAAS